MGPTAANADVTSVPARPLRIAAALARRWPTAAMQRRRASWVVLAVLLAVMIALRALDVVAPSAVLVTVALIVLVWGAVRGQLHRSGTFRLQALGMIGFGALALVGLAVDPDLGRYLVAAGWFLHGIWDLVHL